MDNWSVHRSIEMELHHKLNQRGAILLWNPPNSPDLNPIEKLFNVILSKMSRRLLLLSLGHFGIICPFSFGDFVVCLHVARLSFHGVLRDLENKFQRIFE